MSQDSSSPKKTAPAGPLPAASKPASGWRDPARRRSFNLGASNGKYPKSPPTKS